MLEIRCLSSSGEIGSSPSNRYLLRMGWLANPHAHSRHQHLKLGLPSAECQQVELRDIVIMLSISLMTLGMLPPESCGGQFSGNKPGYILGAKWTPELVIRGLFGGRPPCSFPNDRGVWYQKLRNRSLSLTIGVPKSVARILHAAN